MALALDRAPRGKAAFGAQPQSVAFFEHIGCRRALTGFVAAVDVQSSVGESRCDQALGCFRETTVLGWNHQCQQQIFWFDQMRASTFCDYFARPVFSLLDRAVRPQAQIMLRHK